MATEKEELEDATAEYASPPCFMHEFESDFTGEAFRLNSPLDIARWRKAERQRLIDERLLLQADERQRRAERIGDSLDRALGEIGGRIVSGYWPFRGEPDLRNWQTAVIARGARIALPVVIRKGWPLEFRIWAPGDPLERGAWNILVPARGPAVEPDVVIAPVVGFDGRNYRLGYGGGFFDRTLAAMNRKPLAVGVGYAEARIPSIRPQPHDIAMDMIVTDAT